MQQEEGGGDNKPQNQQDRRLKPMQGENNQPQQHQPQKCPRCESLNTKFCYYNNYSLSQPRYFCKTCRRYWTQGGTLRNVPVGGGCRKGKRTKTSSSGENSRSSQPPQQPQPPQQVHQNLTNPQNILSSNPIITANPVLRSKESGNLAMGSYYPGSGFFSSLAAIQPLNQPAQSFNQPLNQALNVVGGGGVAGHEHLGGSSNLGLLQGFSVPPYGSPQHQQIHQTQFYQMGNREKGVNPMYHPSEEISLMHHSNRHGGSSSSLHHHQDWHQSFINSNTNPNVSDTALWSISTSTSSGNTNTNNNNTGSASASASLNPNQWPDLSGYGPPP